MWSGGGHADAKQWSRVGGGYGAMSRAEPSPASMLRQDAGGGSIGDRDIVRQVVFNPIFDMLTRRSIQANLNRRRVKHDVNILIAEGRRSWYR